MSLRPTAVQASGRGALHGTLVGAAGSVVLCAVGLIAGGLAMPAWVAVVAPIVVGGGGGATFGYVFGRDEGADIDDLGMQLVPGTVPAYVAWPHIADLRTERHGGRIHITVYLDDGWSVRLRAPYDGPLLAADPDFEHKLFMLRHLWETHRYAREW